jgi:NAD(P)-dependent dehydrogenase (short-subunit alcohol dehydrogenase family)
MSKNWKTILSIAGAILASVEAAHLLLRASRRISIRNKVTLITGGSRGLGLVLAREFAARGARIAICARSEPELERVREEFARSGWPLLAVTCDVGVRGEVRRMIALVGENSV